MQRKKLVIALAMAMSSQYSQAQFSSQLNLSDLDGSNGLVFNGVETGDKSGRSVSAAGDVNGDGIDDVIIGAYFADPNGNSYTGSSYVVFGSDSGLPYPMDLSLINGTNGFEINGANAYDFSGVSVSAAGDVNGDGIDDLIIGANGADPHGNSEAGSSYVVFGGDSGLAHPLDLSLINGSNGFVINGLATGDNSGFSVSAAGDINGDGIDDVIIGAYGADPNGNSGAGSSYVVFGSSSGLPHPLDLSSLDGSNGFAINGAATNDKSGISVSAAGDFNGDGIDDVIIGANGADSYSFSDAGSSYVVFGSDSGLTHPLNLSLINQTNGFVIIGADGGDESGSSVSAAGDVNGDGIDDVLIGASNVGLNSYANTGRSYVVFGSDSGLAPSLDLGLINGSNGFVINGVNPNDKSGISVSLAGDINGDGMGDLIIGAHLVDANGYSDFGSSYVVFGSDSALPHPLDLSSLDGNNGFVINGVNSNDLSGRSVNAAGDVNGDGIDDVIIGAYGADPNGNSNAGSSYVVFGREKPIFKDGFE